MPDATRDAMTDAERGDRLESMCDRLATKAATMHEALLRVNAAADLLLEIGGTSKDQDARGFANAHALMLIDALADQRIRPAEPACPPGAGICSGVDG